MKQPQYQRIGMGGTFDHFHIGHQHFLQFASQFAQELYIGVTVPEMIRIKTLENLIESYEQRCNSVHQYLQTENIPHILFPLTDVYGQTLENSPVEAVCVTEATVRGGEEINRKRKELQLSPLPVHVCDLQKDASGQIISSTRIRAGEIGREGKIYQQLFSHDFILQPQHREFFAQKQGSLMDLLHPQVSTVMFPQKLCVVGDHALETFVTKNWKYDLGIYDGLSQRAPYHHFLPDNRTADLHATNPAGSISTDLIQSLITVLKNPAIQIIKVEGEEDLAVVALVLLLPLGSKVYYGQRNEGIVEVHVTEERKEAFYHALTK